MTIWAWLLLIIVIAATIAYAFIWIYYYKYIPLYLSARVTMRITIPLYVFGLGKSIYLLYRDIKGIRPLTWPSLWTYLIVMGYVLYIGLIVYLLIHYGWQIKFRAKFRRFRKWGPYYTFADSQTETLYKNFVDNKKKREEKVSFIETFPEREGSRKLLIAGDIHAGGCDIRPLTTLLLKEHKDAFALVSLGDTVGDGRKWSHWKTFFGQSHLLLRTLPLIVIPGNHDGYTIQGYRKLRMFFPQPFESPQDGLFFTIRHKGLQILFLDNFNASKQYLFLSDSQIEWIKKTVKEADNDPSIYHIIFAMHMTPDSLLAEGFNEEYTSHIYSLLKLSPKIKMIIGGHYHAYFVKIISIDGRKIYSIITGGGGGRTELGISEKYLDVWGGKRPTNPYDVEYDEYGNPKDYVRYRHFLSLTWDDKSIHVEARAWDNDIFHSFEVS